MCACIHVQSHPTLCDPMDCSPPGSSVHGTLQARILEWVTICFSRESSIPWNLTCVYCIRGRFFTTGPPGKFHTKYILYIKYIQFEYMYL